MTIYGEYLFIENLITTFVLLLLTGKLAGCRFNRKRLTLGSIFGGASSLIIFVQMTPLLSVLVRLVLGTLCILISFGSKKLIKITALFFVMSFCSGGLAMAFSLWIQSPSIFHYGIIYMATYSYLRILCLGILAFGFTYWFVKFIRAQNVGRCVFGTVCLIFGEKEYYFDAFVDSGNSLRDPLSDKPVILIDKIGAQKLQDFRKNFPEKFRLIPYRSVGVECGMLESIRADRAIFENKIVEGIQVAFYQGSFSGYEVLLNRDFLEGGLFEKNN